MKQVLLTDVCDIRYGYAFDSALFSDSEGVPLVRIRDVVRGSSETFTTEPFSEDYAVRDGDILIGMDGEFNIAKWRGGNAALNQRVCKMIPKRINEVYLLYFMRKTLKAIEDKTPFVTVKHLSAKELNKIIIPLPTDEEQKEIADTLWKVDELISLRKKQLQKLDDLVKSRFVEMFGDPIDYKGTMSVYPMTDVCDIIDGDRGENYPKQDDFSLSGYCLFLNAKNVTKNGFDFSNCMYITKVKDEQLRKGKLQRGDIVLTTRGTIGNLAFYSKEVPFDHVRINSGMVLLRMKGMIEEQFFIEQFRMLLDDIKISIASGSAQPQLPISTMNKIKMIVPEMEKQRDYVDMLEAINKSKTTIKQGLDKLEQMKQTLMQKYFG